MKKAVFISYRRSDSAGYAGRVRDRLDRIFPGRVFMDVADIGSGDDFVRAIEDTLAKCALVIAVIGDKWREPGLGRSFGDAGDYVVLELGMALERGLPVVPLLLGGVVMPSEAQLPDRLKRLARMNAFEIRHTRFDQDVGEFVGEVYRKMNLKPPGRMETWLAMLAGMQQFNEFQRGLYAVFAALCGLVGLLAGILAPPADSASAFLFLLFVAPFWVLGKNSFKIGWVAHLGGVAGLCGAVIGLARATF